MAFKQVRRAPLPLMQQARQTFQVAAFAMSAQQLARGWRRTGTRIEHRNVDLTSRESLVKNRQVADDHGKEAEANPRLYDRQCATQTVRRREVTESQSEKRGAAEVQLSPKARQPLVFESGPCSVVNQTKADD